jgi:hypothetical protein
MARTHCYRQPRATGVWQRLPYGPGPAGRPWTQAWGRARRAARREVLVVQPLLVTSLLLALVAGWRGV